MKSFPPSLLCNVAIWWSARVLRIQTRRQQTVVASIIETWRYITDMCVSEHTCRGVMALCKFRRAHTHTHTHTRRSSQSCSVRQLGFIHKTWLRRQHFLCFLFGERTKKEKKKRSSDFVLKVCLFFRTCLLSLSACTAQMNPSGEPEIQG